MLWEANDKMIQRDCLYKELSYDMPIRKQHYDMTFFTLKNYIVSPSWKQRHLAQFLIPCPLTYMDFLISGALLKLFR